ncbi:MAG: hypothetical protein FWH07_02450 [Oscillospiraceae bacterium]|nr:hypothetical protein [Oscillospiraceae bacterium]
MKAKNFISVLVAVALTLCLIATASANQSDTFPRYLEVGFNDTGTRLEFRAAKGGIPAQTALGWVSDGENSNEVKFIGDIHIQDGKTSSTHSPGIAGAVVYNENAIAGGIAVSDHVPEGNLFLSLEVVGTGRISMTGNYYIVRDGEEVGIPFNVSVSNEICEGECNICSVKPKLGFVIGGDDVTIFDALEVLKNLVDMDGSISNCESSRSASLITVDSINSGEPSIFDTLEILKHLVGMDSMI